MAIKGGWQHLIGRRIVAVVTVPPIGPSARAQIHLVLDGGVNFEIYSSSGDIGGTMGVYPGGLRKVLGYGCVRLGAEVFGERRVVPR